MSLDSLWESLEKAYRISGKIWLEPRNAPHIHPATFGDIGHATYRKDHVPGVVVDTAPSCANWLEAQIWDSNAQDVIPALQGIPYIRAIDQETGQFFTSSITVDHRLSSKFFKDRPEYRALIEKHLLCDENGKRYSIAMPIVPSRLAQFAAAVDINSINHGACILDASIGGGQFNFSRVVFAQCDATYDDVAQIGGAKRGVLPSLGKGDGEGTFTFQKPEFVTREIILFYEIEIQYLRSLHLTEAMNRLVIAMGLYKLKRMLEGGWTPRSNCRLRYVKSAFAEPSENFELPSLEDLESALPGLVKAAYPNGASVLILKLDLKPYEKTLQAKKDLKASDNKGRGNTEGSAGEEGDLAQLAS